MIGSTLDFNAHQATLKPQSGLPTKLVYVGFFSVALLIHHWIAEGEFSSVLTMSAIFELLALSLLGIHVLSTGSVEGISAKSLQLEAIALASRLSSTTWLLGYLPLDASGDYLYQSFDAASLIFILVLLYHMLKVHRYNVTYDAENDQLSLTPFLTVCFVLACLLHADLDERPMFDTLWYFGLFLTSVAPMPYLWLMARSKTAMPALACHFIAVMAISRIMSGAYMWEAHEEFTCEPYFGEFNHAGWSAVGAHAVHLILLADFAYFYVKNLTKSGLNAPMEVTGTWMV